MTRRRGRRRKKLLDDVKDRRGNCQLKEEALDRTMWRNRFGRDFGLPFDRLLMMMMMIIYIYMYIYIHNTVMSTALLVCPFHNCWPTLRKILPMNCAQ